MVAEITANYSSTDPGICPDAIFWHKTKPKDRNTGEVIA